MHFLREWRHNPCIMGPMTSIGMLILGLVWFITMVLSFPGFVLGFLASPLMKRLNFVVEFLYPTAAGRWFHLTISKMVMRGRKPKPNDRNYGFHSRTMETRIEFVPGRIYVHILPQLLDNLGYLIVCVPESQHNETEVASTKLGKVSMTSYEPNSIVACVVDCGDAEAVARQVGLIQKIHYGEQLIEIQSVLSTHKHHDHTAGNKNLLKNPDLGPSIKLVCGGAVEKVPECNYPLADGDRIPLPKDGENDMSKLVEIEAVATPAHTRGSMTYILRTKEADGPVMMFTGDTVFSGGGGVPFEADTDPKQEDTRRKTAFSLVKAGAATYSTERCFAELLHRSYDGQDAPPHLGDRLLVMTGHEYTHELLSRQFTNKGENCRWNLFSPTTFFDVCSEYFVAQHRRHLPTSSGRLLNTPSTIKKELRINPHFRSLLRRGESVATAIRHWHDHFATQKISLEDCKNIMEGRKGVELSKEAGAQSGSDESHWNLDWSSFDSKVFTTLYSDDLDALIKDLEGGSTSPEVAAIRLKEMKQKLQEPIIRRRPVPETLPSEKQVYRALVGLAILGSRPCAMTLSDSKEMKLPAPIINDSDQILISKKRLMKVLQWLGVMKVDTEGVQLSAMIYLLWKAAREYENSAGKDANYLKSTKVQNYDAVDLTDMIHLGSLKWLLFGVPSIQRPALPFSYCMPCVKKPTYPSASHPASATGFPVSGAELARHNVYTCKLCRSATGCQHFEEEVQTGNGVQMLYRVNSSPTEDGDDDEPFVEMTHILQEA